MTQEDQCAFLVLVVDGLRPDFLGPYGGECVETPTLDQWAANGVVFDAHYADGLNPGAFERAIRTGRHPLAPTAGDYDLFADIQAAGVRLARVRAPDRDADEPLALKPTRRAVRQAIDQLSDAPQALLWVEIDALLPPWQISEDGIADLIEEETADEANESNNEVIEPWTGPLPDWIAANDDESYARLQRAYAAAVASLDAGLERLLGDCSKRGWGDDALRILTSSRGLPLGEHEAVGFVASRPYEELIHLPLLWRWPNAGHSGMRVPAFSQPADLAPTLRELFGLERGEGGDEWTGRSLVTLIRGEHQPLRPTAFVGQREGSHVAWGMRSQEWYLLLDHGAVGSHQLYVKPDDRWEVNDVFQRHLELAEELERQARLRFVRDA